jgi:hypothetical protein
MPPAPASAEREEERRLNTRTLTIASVASATAAAVTSQLWIAGTWIAAAVTPVLVALISEAMHRPTERIARAWSSDGEPRVSRRQTATRREPAAVTGTPGPVRVYRQTGSGARPTLTRRRIAIGGVALTAAIAFVIGIVALTTVDLVSGGSVGKGSGRTTLLSGSGSGGGEPKDSQQDATPQQQQPEPRQEQNSQPSETGTTTAPETPPSDTAPAPPTSTTPPGEPAPDASP